MSASVPNDAQSRLRKLDQVIGKLHQETLVLEDKRAKMSRISSGLNRRLSYLWFMQWFRSPVKSMELWPVAVLIVGPLITGALMLMIFHFLFASLQFALLGFVIGILIGLGTFLLLLYSPTTEALEARIKDGKLELHRVKEDAVKISDDIQLITAQLKTYSDERSDLISSVRFQRERLLQRNWKAMRDTEWESYLAEVFCALGGVVELTKIVGDQGVDLIVQFGNKRIAVQAKGYFNSVSNAAVQQAVAGMAHYGCTGCAVITNSRFTKSAEELAASNDCVLIGEDQFPAFVLGERDL